MNLNSLVFTIGEGATVPLLTVAPSKEISIRGIRITTIDGCYGDLITTDPENNSHTLSFSIGPNDYVNLNKRKLLLPTGYTVVVKSVDGEFNISLNYVEFDSLPIG